MESIGKVLDSLSARYENFILIGDFNAEESDTTIKDFCDIYSFENLIKDATFEQIRTQNRSLQGL